MSIQADDAANPVPASTIMIIRDAPDGLEVFMVKRHHQIDFVAGALVFPGGKASPADFDTKLIEMADGTAGRDARTLALAATAIREAFEESGILFARDEVSGEMVPARRLEALQDWRKRLESGESSLLDLLRREKLRLACDALVPFAHWITPRMMPKRFDTLFFLARMPQDQTGRHDGRESVDSVWIRPDDAIADRKKWNVIFPTKLNLMKLAQSGSVEDAIRTTRKASLVPVEPWVEDGPEGRVLRIRADAGYEQTSALMRDGL